jgi:hypothetical protein
MTAITLVSTVQVGVGGASTIEFNTIPQTGKHLMLTVSGRSTTSPGNTFALRMRFNDSTSGYVLRYLEGSGSGGVNNGTYALTSIGDMYVIPGDGNTGDVFGTATIHVPNYTLSQKKQVAIEGAIEAQNTSTAIGQYSGNWNNTSAITKVTLFLDSGNFLQNTSASLYVIS